MASKIDRQELAAYIVKGVRDGFLWSLLIPGIFLVGHCREIFGNNNQGGGSGSPPGDGGITSPAEFALKKGEK